MKNTDKTFSDPVLENNLKNQHRQYLPEAEHRGKLDGVECTDGAPINSFEERTEFIKTKYANMRIEVDKVIQPEIVKNDGTNTMEESNKEDIDLEKKGIDNELEINKSISLTSGNTPFPHPIIVGVIMAFGIGWVDSDMTAQSFQTISDSTFGANLMAMVLVICLLLIKVYFKLNLLPAKLAHLNDKLKSILIGIVIFLIAMLRVKYFEAMCKCDVNDLYVVVIGFVTMIGLYLCIDHLIIRKIPQLKNWMAERRHMRENQNLLKEKARLEDLRKQKRAETLQNLRHFKSKILYGEFLKENISNYEIEAISAYRNGFNSTYKPNSGTSFRKIYACIIWGLLCLTALSSCHKPPPNCTCNTVFVDITDSLLSVAGLNIEPFLPESNIKSENFHNEFYLTIVPITEFTFTHKAIFSFPAGDPIYGNSYYRKIEVDKLSDSIKTYVSTIKKLPKGKGNTNIFGPLFEEFNRISQNQKCSIRTVTINSDLLENSNKFSLYKPETLKLFQTEPDKAIMLLESVYKIGNYPGVKFSLNHLSKTTEEDQAYEIVSRVIRMVLIKHGAEELNF